MDFELHQPLDGLYTNFRWAFGGMPQEMLVRSGRVVERGASIDAGGLEAIDLGGRRLSPAFYDAHCHILPGGLDLQKLHLGECGSADDVLDLVRKRDAELDPDQWLMAVHYDQTKFSGATHLTRHDLDKVSSLRPILLRHVNGHASVANSAVLERAGVTRDTPDPKGGTILREDGEPNGVLLENAHEMVTATAPTPTLEQMVEAILAAGSRIHAKGIVEATDMMTGRYDLPREIEAYRIAAERGNPLRVRLCIQWSCLFGPKAKPFEQVDTDRVKTWGAKIFADGAIGSATAAIRGTFASDRASSGTLMYAPERLRKMIHTAHDAGWTIAIHSIGDRSTDLVMDAYSELDAPSRHRIEHAMMLDDEQISRMKALGIHCTMQPEFLNRFGHSYKHHLGPERASRLKRFRSVLDAGIPLSFSSDYPIVAGDPWIGVETASSRPTGFDPAENLSFEEALWAYTAMGAVANGGRNELVAGDRAEFLTF